MLIFTSCFETCIQLHTSNYQVICVETGNKVYKKTNKNLIPNTVFNIMHVITSNQFHFWPIWGFKMNK